MPPETLEAALCKRHESAIQLLLEFVLDLGDFSHNSFRTGAHRNIDILGRRHAYIAIFVVVHIGLDGAAEGAGGRVERVRAAPTAVPEVLRAVLVCDKDQGNGAVIVGRVHTHGRGREMLSCGGSEGAL